VASKAPIILCGSLSRHPVALGAAMHNAGYAALGLPFSYVPFATEDLEGSLRGMRALGIRGFGISMPFKIEIIPLLDGVDELAAKIGAVNTVVNDDGVLTGYNTDASGSARALSEAMSLRGRRVVVIGAGGAARAVSYALCAEGVRVHVVNRTPSKARELAREIATTFSPMASSRSGPASGALPMATAGGLDDLNDLSAFDAVVNCSSAGMQEYGEESLVPENSLRPELVVMDIVYEPIETELVRSARARGATVIHGGRMLLHQACAQFQLYTGRSAPEDAMNAALERVISVKPD
jgi:shikimate dehydrogenase